MWVDRVCCWFSSLLRGFFSWFSGFPPSTKPTLLNSNSIWNQRVRTATVWNMSQNSHYSHYLFWKPHIHDILSKADELLGLLRQTCPLLADSRSRRTLYLPLVMSQLSYASQVWSPCHVAQKKVDSVQGRATRWIVKARIGDTSHKHRPLALKP